jgi:hypothetical protein
MHNTLTQSPLQKLFSIQGWGKRNFQGAHFSIKFRVPKHDAAQVAKIKARHPETIVHIAETTEYILFGGTYSSMSRFLDDCKLFLKLQVR